MAATTTTQQLKLNQQSKAKENKTEQPTTSQVKPESAKTKAKAEESVWQSIPKRKEGTPSTDQLHSIRRMGNLQLQTLASNF